MPHYATIPLIATSMKHGLLQCDQVNGRVFTILLSLKGLGQSKFIVSLETSKDLSFVSYNIHKYI